MPTHSPLPSFHNSPASTPPRAHSPVFFGSSSSHSPASSNNPSGAVAEKVALSYQRARGEFGGPFRTFRGWFQAVRIPISSSGAGGGGSSTGSAGGMHAGKGGGPAGGARRELSIPVLKFLHPSRPLPFFSSRTPPFGKRTPALSSSRYDHHHHRGGGGGGALVRIVLAIAGTLFFFVFAFASFLRLFHATVSIGRSKGVHMPFTDPSTLVFSPAEIERVWRWEIASGHYPSRRSTPGVSFDLPEGGGGAGIDRDRQRVAAPVQQKNRIENPGLPRKTDEDLRRERIVKAEVERRLRAGGKDVTDSSSSSSSTALEVVPVGPVREYLDLPLPGSRQAHAYPPRPDSRAALDLDAVMDHCDFAENKYVRDCLEVLRVNGGLEMPLRRGSHDPWKSTYIPEFELSSKVASDGGGPSLRMRDSLDRYRHQMDQVLDASNSAFSALLAARQQLTLSNQVNPLLSNQQQQRRDGSQQVPIYEPHPSHPNADPACDPDFPRLFHIFWAGPFTDKPYSAALSFLYTQHLALDRPIGVDPTRLEPALCRPQLWIWINPGPASSFPDPRAERKMRDDLARNPWSAPLLHRRFADVVKFRLWNTTEQLDGVSEMHGWRDMRLFNSGGVKYGSAGEAKRAVNEAAAAAPDGLEDEKVVEAEHAEAAGKEGGGDMAASAEAALLSAREATNNGTVAGTANLTQVAAPLPTKHKDELFEIVGSTANKYDRLSVVLSDMARFVLTHRFGGVYLDADTILLRDWTELFNWHGAFAYRWSRLEKYNTAVLKMQRGSALGHFIFRTAVANDLDFHPMTVSRYTKDANLEGLLLRLPDALFDPAWLNTWVFPLFFLRTLAAADISAAPTRSEYYQRDRPPQPYFKRFEDFFDTPKEINAAPVATGFDGFFRGAFSYHFHNFWCVGDCGCSFTP